MLTKCIDKNDLQESWQFIKPINFQDCKEIADFGEKSGLSFVKDLNGNWFVYLIDEKNNDTYPVELNNKDILIHHVGEDDWHIESYKDYVVDYQEI